MRTVGVEEELLLVDASNGTPAAIGDAVVTTAELLADDEALIDHEFKQEQAELGSSPCESLAELRADLITLRANLFDAARLRGGLAVAIATSPLKVRPHPTDDERYQRMNHEFGLLARQQLTCGQHVHVAVDSRAEGVAVLDRIRVWLPVVLAISANSPFWQGSDTGYGSYRTVLWNLWPTAGPNEPFGDLEEYDRRARELIETGAALDDGMLYFDARLSAHYPTVEIRVADVCTDVDDAVLVAGLCRALVQTAVDEWSRNETPIAASSLLLRAAHWRAARWGMTGELYHPVARKAVDAWQLAADLVDHVRPALQAAGDDELVESALTRLRACGGGAQRQRESAAHSGGLRAVVADAAKRTVAR